MGHKKITDAELKELANQLKETTIVTWFGISCTINSFIHIIQ